MGSEGATAGGLTLSRWGPGVTWASAVTVGYVALKTPYGRAAD